MCAHSTFFTFLAIVWAFPVQAQPQPPLQPLLQTVDLNVGDSQEVELADGSKARVKLLNLKETRDTLRQAVRRAEIVVEVNGSKATLVSANYRLPVTVAGVQIDCPVTRGYRQNSSSDCAARTRGASTRTPACASGRPAHRCVEPGTFRYPARQRWFASGTQMANEPVYVDGGENPLVKQIYYHYGLDIGGAEGLVEVVAATDGLVVSSGKAVLPGYDDTPVKPRYDVVYLLDDRGWYYRYSHLHTIRPGDQARRRRSRWASGSACWARKAAAAAGRTCTSTSPAGSRRASGASSRATPSSGRPTCASTSRSVLAVARPHHLAAVGEKVVLDGSRSWSADGKIARYDWTFTDGQTATGATVERTYAKPGVYSEVLKVTDGAGRIDYDFAVVNVLDREHPDRLPPSIHAAYYADVRHQAGRPGDVPGAHVPHHGRQGDLGLRRRQPEGGRCGATATSCSWRRTATPARSTAFPNPAITWSAFNAPTIAATRARRGCTYGWGWNKLKASWYVKR